LSLYYARFSKHGLRYRTATGGNQPLVVETPSAEDAERATADLALLKTGIKTSCFIPLGNSETLQVGTPVIAIGYPSLTPSAALYEGFVSSRYKHLPIPVGFVGSKPVYPQYEVIRIQMPITPGTSGSPVIDDGNRVVGVVSEVPVIWTNDLSELVGAMAKQRSSTVMLSGFDTNLLLAKLAWIVHDFESPGAGLAVPVSYLKPPVPSK
jgi:hypothetical protein